MDYKCVQRGLHTPRNRKETDERRQAYPYRTVEYAGLVSIDSEENVTTS